MAKDTRDSRVDRDGVRVVENGGGRRAAGVRLVIGVLATAVIAAVALTAIAVLFVRNAPGTQPAPEGASMPPTNDQRIATQAVGPVRAVPKLPAAPVDQVATPTRAAISNRRRARAAPTPAADRAGANAAPANPATNRAMDAAQDRNSAEAQEHRQMESLARDFIEGLKATGETRGLAAFPPPGTSPIKTGLVVPDGFELPQGYVRYYQITDEGERLEPILMFSPDYEFVDTNGNPIALPDDGVVPPGMAPPGLPLRPLEVPKAPRTAASGPRGGGS